MVTTNKEAGYRLFDRLVDDWKNRRFPFDRTEVPQHPKNLPPAMPLKGREHALFLFHACYWMKGGIQSDQAIRSLTRIWNNHQRFFDPLHARDNPDFVEELTRALEQNGLGFGKNTFPLHWHSNLLKLHNYWDTDPRMFFDTCASYDELCKQIIGKGAKQKWDPSSSHGFLGFRHKMVSMLIYFLEASHIIDRPFLYAVPVDFHVLRLLTAHEVLVVDTVSERQGIYSDHLLEKARDLTMEYCDKTQAKEIDLCNGLWLFSNTLCNRNPNNRTIIPKERTGRSTEVKPFEFDWTNSRVRRHEETCLRCSVAPSCSRYVPAGNYYVQGKISALPKDNEPPQLYLGGVIPHAIAEAEGHPKAKVEKASPGPQQLQAIEQSMVKQPVHVPLELPFDLNAA